MHKSAIFTAIACCSFISAATAGPLTSETHNGNTFFALDHALKQDRSFESALFTYQTEVHDGQTFTTWGVTHKQNRLTDDARIAACLEQFDVEICDDFADALVKGEEIPMDYLPEDIEFLPADTLTAQAEN